MKSIVLSDAAKLRERADALEAKAIEKTSPAECERAAKRIKSREGNVAIFLGAGASKAFGWPLTNELLPAMLDGLANKDLFEDDRINTSRHNAEDRELLGRTLQALCPGLLINTSATQPERLPLVTSLLSMLDYSLATGQGMVSGFTGEQIRHARLLMERSIYEIVAHELVADQPKNWPLRQANKLAHDFGQWLDSLRRRTALGAITSNYDVAMEQVWGFNQKDGHRMQLLKVDLGFPWLWASNNKELIMPRPGKPKRRLYKLHGSTNWLRCALCDRTYVNPSADIAINAFNRNVNDNNTCHCGHSKLEMQIVSPSFVRDMRSPNLTSLWQCALDWLRCAEDWIIIGYSFPDEDLNIRSLFARALAAGKSPNITVIQRGWNNQTRTRYEAFFPASRLYYLTGGLEVFLQYAG